MGAIAGRRTDGRIGRSEDEDDARIAAYSKAVTAQAGSAHLESLLARAYIQKMRETVDFSYLDKASALVDGVLTRDPGNYEALRLRSEVDMERHEFARVAEYAREMSRFAPDDSGQLGDAGRCADGTGALSGSRGGVWQDAGVAAGPCELQRVAWYQFVTGHLDDAIALMKSAIAADSPAAENVAWCWNDLGNICFKMGHLRESEDAYAKALAAFPGYYPASAGMGRVLAAQKRWKEAIDAYRRAQATVPMPEFAAAVEDLYGRAGNAVESRKQRELLDAIDHTNRASGERTNRNLALIFADHDCNLDRAAELADNEIKVRPDVYTQDAVAWVPFKQKRYEEAETAAEKAIALGTSEPSFYYHAALIAQAMGRTQDASVRLETAMRLKLGIRPGAGREAQAQRVSAQGKVTIWPRRSCRRGRLSSRISRFPAA